MGRSNTKKKRVETGVDLSAIDVEPEAPSGKVSNVSKVGGRLAKQVEADQEAFDADITQAEKLFRKKLTYEQLNPNRGKKELGVKVPESEIRKRRSVAVEDAKHRHRLKILDVSIPRKRIQEEISEELSNFFNEDGERLFKDHDKVADAIARFLPVDI